MNRNIRCEIDSKIFKNYAEKVFVYLRSAKTKSADYNPHYDVVYNVTSNSPLTVKAIVRTVRPNSLIVRELGLVSAGAIEIIVKDQDATLITLSQKVTHDSVNYTVFNDALNNQVQVFSLPFGYSKIIMFRKND